MYLFKPNSMTLKLYLYSKSPAESANLSAIRDLGMRLMFVLAQVRECFQALYKSLASDITHG